MPDASVSTMALDPSSARVPARTSLRLLNHADLTPADYAAWNHLGTQPRSAENANVFAQPWVVAAGLRHCGDAGIRLAFVHDADGDLVGVVPLVKATRLGRFPLRHWAIWNHPNSFCAPVLIAPGAAARFWAGLRDGLGTSPDSRGLCALVQNDCPLDGDNFHGLAQVVAVRKATLAIVERHARAMASDGQSLAGYWDRNVRAKKRKELRRQAARLAELGTLTSCELAPGDDPARWIKEFLALEQHGWKGAAGSALAAAPGTMGYFRDVVLAAHARGSLSFMALRLDGRAIAMLVTLFDGDAAFSFKTAYDEDLARFSPGVQIQRDNLVMLADRGVTWADSCAAADHPMIDSLWAERRQIGTVAFALPGTASKASFAAYRAALTGWRALKQLRRQTGNHA